MNARQQHSEQPAARRFEFDLARPFFEQLRAFFDSLGAAPLTEEAISDLAPLQGVYGLLLGGRLVYVGKAEGGPISARLTDHRLKLAGRENIQPEEVRFRAAYLAETWTPLAPEKNLISHYRRQGLCEWNGNGFGPHDPGRNREETDKPTQGFDVHFPIRADFATGIRAGDYEANELLKMIKRVLPYTFRYETDDPQNTWAAGSTKYNGRTVRVPDDDMPARQLIRTVAEQLGPGWQATEFPSHFILYQETRAYVHGQVLWPQRPD